MRVSGIPFLWVAILITIQASSFAANLDVIKEFHESRSKDANDPPDKITEFSCIGSEGTPPRWGNILVRAFQRKKQGPNEEKGRPTWPPLTFGRRTVAATVLTVAAAIVSSAGGIGGGGLFLPILNLVLGFDSKTSAALSAFMVLGGSIANLIYCVPRKHPGLVHKPLIDYDIALLLQPNMLLGISLGVVFNVMFPEWLITALLASFLSAITFFSCKNAFRLWKTETFLRQMINPEKSNSLSSVCEDGVPHGNGLGSSSTSISGSQREICKGTHNETCNGIQPEDISVQVSCSTVYQEGRESLQEPLLNGKSEQSKIVPLKKLAVLALVWVLFYSVYELRGGKDQENFLHIQPCGLAYWLISALQIPFALSITIWTLSRSGNSEKHSNQQVLSKATECCETFVFSIMALLAGILGGMFGIGGGMLINPFLLQIGLSPQATAATCSFMVFFSSSMSVAQFSLLGVAPLEYALYFAITCFISSVFGLIIIQRATVKHGRVSLIIFSVSIVMGVSAILMITFGVIDVWRQCQDGDSMGFRAPC